MKKILSLLTFLWLLFILTFGVFNITTNAWFFDDLLWDSEPKIHIDCETQNCNISTGTEIIKNIEWLESANNLAFKKIIKNHASDPKSYNLDSFVLRQEIALISRRVSWVSEKKECDNLFNDVTATTPNTWACKNIEALVDNNLISANTSFNPENNISKSEALIMFIKSIWFPEFKIDENSPLNWQQQVVAFGVENWVVENFTDYNTEAKRWWIFQIADFSIKVKEDRVRKWTWKNKFYYSDEVL